MDSVQTGPLKKKTILVAEDYADIRMMMKIMLEVHGYDVLEAADGYEAVEIARQHHPDLILLDLAMPILDGLEAASSMRQFETLSETPIIAVTAYGDFYRDKALEAGCDDVVMKPLDFESIKPLVERYLGSDHTEPV